VADWRACAPVPQLFRVGDPNRSSYNRFPRADVRCIRTSRDAWVALVRRGAPPHHHLSGPPSIQRFRQRRFCPGDRGRRGSERRKVWPEPSRRDRGVVRRSSRCRSRRRIAIYLQSIDSRINESLPALRGLRRLASNGSGWTVRGGAPPSPDPASGTSPFSSAVFSLFPERRHAAVRARARGRRVPHVLVGGRVVP